MKQKILMIEDDPLIRNELDTLLQCSCVVKYHQKTLSN